MFERIVKPLLFSFDAEHAHHIGMDALQTELFAPGPFSHPSLTTTLFGKVIPNPLGLAAGFDKDGLAIDSLGEYGFGFVEVGTVTPLPQSGNPKPRLFRIQECGALINRMGFNNAGIDALVKKLESRQTHILVGVNIGKNKFTPNESAHEDYAKCAKRLNGLCDYLVVNVSSPNTPGLRELQESESLKRIIASVRDAKWCGPLCIKISPDLEESDVEAVAQVVRDEKVDGVIATNTTLSRPEELCPIEEDGGLSGEPLKSLASTMQSRLRQSLPTDTTLISVGGITTGIDLRDALKIGAQAAQIYTSFVYRGPRAAHLILNEFLTP